MERRAANGNYIAYACGPLIGRYRYINERIELELIDFKIEIEEKFQKSKVNKNFKYPRVTSKQRAMQDIQVLIGEDEIPKIVENM